MKKIRPPIKQCEVTWFDYKHGQLKPRVENNRSYKMNDRVQDLKSTVERLDKQVNALLSVIEKVLEFLIVDDKSGVIIYNLLLEMGCIRGGGGV